MWEVALEESYVNVAQQEYGISLYLLLDFAKLKLKEKIY